MPEPITMGVVATLIFSSFVGAVVAVPLFHYGERLLAYADEKINDLGLWSNPLSKKEEEVLNEDISKINKYDDVDEALLGKDGLKDLSEMNVELGDETQ